MQFSLLLLDHSLSFLNVLLQQLTLFVSACARCLTFFEVSIIIAHFTCAMVAVIWSLCRCSAYVSTVSMSCWLTMCWCFMRSIPTVLWAGWSENPLHCYHLDVWYTTSSSPSRVEERDRAERKGKHYIYCICIYICLDQILGSDIQ